MQRLRRVMNSRNFIKILDIPDFDMLLMVAIGSREFIHPDIKEQYNQNKEYFYGIFKQSPYYEDERIACLSAENYKAIQQYIGIYLHEKSLQKNEQTMRFIKKGFRFVFNYIKNTKQIDFYQIRDGYFKHVNKHAYDKTVQSAHIFSIALYLCEEFNKDIIFDDFDINLLNSSIQQVFSDLTVFLPENKMVEEFLAKYKKMGIQRNDFNIPLNNLVIAMNHIHKEQYAVEKNIDFDRNIESLNEIIKSHPFSNGITQTALLLQYCNVHPIDLQNITAIDKKIMKDLVALAYHAIDNKLTNDDIYSVLGSYLLLYSLMNDYNLTKHNYMITSHEETYLELQQLKNEYENKINSLQLIENLKNNEIHQLRETGEKLQSTIMDLEKQLSKKDIKMKELKEDIYRLEEKQKEVDRLLSIQQDSTSTILEVSFEEMVEYLNRKKGVIIGGNQGWQENLRTILTDFRFILPEELHMNLDFLTNQDFIIFNESYNNHSMFNKVKSTIANVHIPIIYTGTATNTNLTIQSIYSKILKLDENK
ncbi:MAG: hypothetical protein Q8934_09460 [Bacillota bacterium]|nr:hypothetical protein [Bacillota bacterium]